MQPFQVPVSGDCGHTFCKECIEPWLTRNSTCPTCRSGTSTGGFRPISTRIVINQLGRLLMRCKRCREENIQRDNTSEHDKRCPDQTVSCPAFDIKCMWKGTRNALLAHVQECPFQKIRPAIDEIYAFFNNVYEPLVEELQAVRQQLEKQTKRNSEQNRFFLAVFNQGRPMSSACIAGGRYCQFQESIRRRNMTPMALVAAALKNQQQANKYPQPPFDHLGYRQQAMPSAENVEIQGPGNNLVRCSNCQSDVEPENVALHHCQGGCICRQCLQMYGNVDASGTNPGNAS